MKTSLSFALAAILAGSALAASSPGDIKGFAPVSVSAANYRATPREEVRRAVENAKSAVNPEVADLKPLASPQHYIFMRGETFEADMTYDQVTTLLTPALAKKGYINGADAAGIIRKPENVALVLRVSFGERLWRLPTVRTDNLTWNDGMVARPRGTGLHTLGGDSRWDQRAGGDDGVFDAIAANDAAGSIGLGTAGGGARAPGGASSGALDPNTSVTATGRSEYGVTRDFELIVVDAFDYHELKAKGINARRVWSTFVAAPKQRGQKFSDLLPTLIRNAAPYFGETSKGLQVYSDARAEVKIGEMVEVKDEPAAPKK